jgi:hypothetical protein
VTGIISQMSWGGSPEPPPGDCAQSPVPDSPKANRELQTLLHPEMLGRAFQVLLLDKKTDPGATQLMGFKFAREPRLTPRFNES